MARRFPRPGRRRFRLRQRHRAHAEEDVRRDRSRLSFDGRKRPAFLRDGDGRPGKHSAAASLRGSADLEAQAQAHLRNQAEDLDYEDRNWPILRQQREAAKDQIDPHRHDDRGEANSQTPSPAPAETRRTKTPSGNGSTRTARTLTSSSLRARRRTSRSGRACRRERRPRLNMVGPGTVGMNVPPLGNSYYQTHPLPTPEDTGGAPLVDAPGVPAGCPTGGRRRV